MSLVGVGTPEDIASPRDERNSIEVSEGFGGAGAFFLGVRRKEDVSLPSANGFNDSS